MSQGERRLAAIMFTDVVGYSSLSERNEKLALELLEEQRAVLRPFFSKNNGKEIKTIGDAFLVEFASALEALTCAFDIQRSLRELTSTQPEERQIALRIGIHLGDVVHRDDDIYGDAVNIASRIESLANPGGICVTSQVYDQVRNKFGLPLVSLGKRELKNIETPIEVYSVTMPWEPSKASQATLIPPCLGCGNPYRRDELSGQLYCPDCDSLLARLPSGRTYMISGDSGVGKSVLLYKFIDIYLRNSNLCILVDFDDAPEKARASVQNFAGNAREKEESGFLKLVDCFSCLGGLKSQERYFMHSPGDLTGLEQLVSRLIGGSDMPEARVLIDSATTLFTRSETDSVMRFLSSLSVKVKSRNGILLFTLGSGAIPGEAQKRLETLADGLMELHLSEAGGRTRRYYRFSKIRGKLYFDQWLPFSIGKEAVRLGPPEEPEDYARFLKVLDLIRGES